MVTRTMLLEKLRLGLSLRPADQCDRRAHHLAAAARSAKIREAVAARVRGAGYVIRADAG